MTQAFNLSQLANKVNTSGQLDAATGLYNTGSVGFPAGTVMLFVQTTAPTGWTKSTTHNDKALRVVNGVAGSGGSVGFTTAFTAGLSGGATTLSTAQMPSHTHNATIYYSGESGPNRYIISSAIGYGSWSSSPFTVAADLWSVGGGGSHTHTLPSFAVSYVDVIIATKD